MQLVISIYVLAPKFYLFTWAFHKWIEPNPTKTQNPLRQDLGFFKSEVLLLKKITQRASQDDKEDKDEDKVCSDGDVDQIQSGWWELRAMTSGLNTMMSSLKTTMMKRFGHNGHLKGLQASQSPLCHFSTFVELKKILCFLTLKFFESISLCLKI